jgi:hypothetical protein
MAANIVVGVTGWVAPDLVGHRTPELRGVAAGLTLQAGMKTAVLHLCNIDAVLGDCKTVATRQPPLFTHGDVNVLSSVQRSHDPPSRSASSGSRP